MENTRTDQRRDLGSAILVMSGVWLALAGGRWVLQEFRPDVAVLAAFSVATVIVLATRRHPDRVFDAVGTPVGILIGFVSFGAWLAVIWWLGSALGLATPSTRQLPVGGLSLMLISTVVLGPLFEELLYRERLLLALESFVGPALALPISAACFALPHLHDWNVLATLCIGLFLGGVMLRTRSIALCIGIHAGLNLATALCGVPAERWTLHWGLSSIASLGILAAVAGSFRRRAVAEGQP